MKTTSILIIIIFFILLDLTKINHLWGENIHRRVLHHLQRGQWDPNKKPWINFINNYLTDDNINYANNINIDKTNCLNNISKNLSNLFGGNYSKKCTLYYNDFPDNIKKELDKIGESMIPKLEKIAGKKLYLGNSNFRCVLLKYEGLNSNFTMHYDTEPKNCYRTLFLIDKEGKPPPFIYYDENKNIINKYLNIGEGIFFKGTKTYHGVGKTDDPNMKRHVIGWQYTTDNSIKDVNLCSKLRDAGFCKASKIFLPYILITLTLSLLLMYFLKDTFSYTQKINLIILTIISFAILVVIPKKYNLGTGLSLRCNRIFIVLFFNSLFFGNIYYTLMFTNYLLLTEMFLPRDIVAYHLKNVS